VIGARVVLLAALTLTRLSVAADAGSSLHITPTGAGRRDGSDWDNAAVLLQLPVLLARAGPGARVNIRADLGPYNVTRPIPLRNGGSPEHPIVVAGIDGSGKPMQAELIGTRADPYDAKGARGSDVFRLLEGANHLRFQYLSFINQGNGCFHIAADVRDIAIENVGARNVQRFVENHVTGTSKSASIEGLKVRNLEVIGFSKGAIRLQYDTHDVLLEDILGDSQHQDGDDFAEGIALEGTVHDVVLRRVTMRNSRDTLHEYWNGDGFATERNVYRIRFEDTLASGNTDAGYDLKSNDTVLIRTISEDNKHNFKLWGRNISVSDCIGKAPHRRGGTGVQDQLEILQGADVTFTRCRFSDSYPATTVFHVESGARLSVTDSHVSKHPDARMSLIEEGATLIFK
jgi:hypothetical protein